MSKRNLIIAGSVVILVILSVLLWWFLLLRSQSGHIETTARGRGFGENIPIFGSLLGSNSTHIRESILDTLGMGGVGVTENNGAAEAPRTPRLWRMWQLPVAGIITNSEASTTMFGFVDSASGNVFSADPITGNVERLTNTLVPKIYRAYWVGNDKVVLQHFTDDIQLRTFVGTVTNATGTEVVGKLTGYYLEDKIRGVVGLPGSSRLFYIRDDGDKNVGIVFDTEKEEPSRIFESVIGGWQLYSKSEDVIILVQNASGEAVGSAYVLNTSGEKKPLILDVRGLTAAVGDTTGTLLYSMVSGDAIELWGKTSTTSAVKIPLTTLAEKCVFEQGDSTTAYCAVPRSIPHAPIPDAWYRGEVSFSDDWWSVDVSDGSIEQIFSPESEFSVSLDVEYPRVSSDGNYIVFLDKNTGAPWALRIHD